MLIQQCIAKVRGIAGRLPLRKMNIAFVASFLSLAVVHSASAAAPSQDPLFLSNPVVPIMMLNMSKDHQLYYKVYDDYSDIDPKNPGVELTYSHTYDYYGYFDSKKCYDYTANNRFEPANKVDEEGYCAGKWSGNFLNWATMTRIDSIRKILYGGLRSTDTATETVLERAFLPHDAHSFAKYYNGTDLDKLTPFDASDVKTKLTRTNGVEVDSTGFTICNTTSGTGFSQLVTNPPKLRLAKGNHMFWASNERWQCKWRTEITDGADRGVNGNNTNITLVDAFRDSPSDANKLSLTVGTTKVSELNARVSVCVTDLEEDNCYKYPTSDHKKPQGLLQEFGEIRNESSVAKINFGLMTGSYTKSKSGGVLRKAIGDMTTEVNTSTDGTFKTKTVGTVKTPVDGVINTLNRLRPYGYSYGDGTYNSGDNCSWGWDSFADGQCSNWGNPQAEIYLESLRYLLGKEVNEDFEVEDEDKIPGLTSVAWDGEPPVVEGNYCAPLNVLQFNASTTSYDGNGLGTSGDVMGTATPATWTDAIATREAISGEYFIGQATGAEDEKGSGLCSGKTIGALSAVRGTCPDAPRLEGSYNIAGLAYYARTNDLLPSDAAKGIKGVKGIQTVRTFGVALAPALPKVEVLSPKTKKKVSILPACKNLSVGGNCALVDFKILSQDFSDSVNSGLLYVNWEDSEQGGDYDQDMWGVIKYAVTDDDVIITTDVVAESTPNAMGFGYVIGGTDKDGPHFQSGIDGFKADDCTTTACYVGDSEKPKSFKWGDSGASFLESPLYYAAKWGGFSEGLVETAIGKADYDPENRLEHYKHADVLAKIKADKLESYYFATDPRELEASLRSAFRDVAKAVGSASAVATNSTRLSEGAYVFQAQFNSEDWSGELNVFEFTANGGLPTKATFTTADPNRMPTSGTGRKVYTFNGTSLVDFAWGNLTKSPAVGNQQDALKLSGETDYTNAMNRVDWLLGNATHENDTDGLRNRGTDDERVILGDIVNSSPAYVGAWDFRYNRLPEGGSSYRDYVAEKKKKNPRIFVGANDGALHAFKAPIEGAVEFEELYAYIPGLAYPKLAAITQANYGTKENEHQFIVDGPITVGDVYMSDTESWRTIIVGTMGAGGRGVYALDVTNDVPKVLWELSEKDYPQLGYVMGKPLIVPMKNNRWAAIFGNGTGSGTTSSLFVVDIEEPRNTAYTKVLDVEAGTGLSAPALLPNAIGQIEVAYAGDLSGNLWRFNLSDKIASNWQEAYLLFAAKDGDNNIQPISAAPTLGLNAPKGDKVMVYFGTGKYFDAGDNSASATPEHSFYAIADIGDRKTVSRGSLFVKTLATSYSDTGPNTRSVIQDVAPVQSPDWANKNGWRLDFKDTDGERVTTKAILLQDWLIFPTLIPSALSCDYGGRSWLMAVRAVGDKASKEPPIDNLLNGFLVLGDVGFGQLGEAGKGAIVGSGTDATLLNIAAEYDASTEGRQSWRQLQ